MTLTTQAAIDGLNEILNIGSVGYVNLDMLAHVSGVGISAVVHFDCPPADFLYAYGKMAALDAFALKHDAYYNLHTQNGKVFSDNDELVQMQVDMRPNKR